MPRARGQLTKADREKAKRGINARQEAVKELLKRHKSEFDELLVQYRVAAGLAPSNGGPSKAQLEAQIRKAEETLAKKRDLLRLVS